MPATGLPHQNLHPSPPSLRRARRKGCEGAISSPGYQLMAPASKARLHSWPRNGFKTSTSVQETCRTFRVTKMRLLTRAVAAIMGSIRDAVRVLIRPPHSSAIWRPIGGIRSPCCRTIEEAHRSRAAACCGARPRTFWIPRRISPMARTLRWIDGAEDAGESRKWYIFYIPWILSSIPRNRRPTRENTGSIL